METAEAPLPRVLLVGAGGLGSAIALTLADSPQPLELILVDGDEVEYSNLNRQILHCPDRLGMAKARSGALTLRTLQPSMRVQPLHMMVTRDNVDRLVQSADLVVDGTDNFETRFILSDACVGHGVPFLHAGVLAWGGQAFTAIPGHTICYRCLLGTPPPAGAVPSATQVGILGAAAGVMGAVQGAEVRCLLEHWGTNQRGDLTSPPEDCCGTGYSSPLTGRLLIWDGLSGSGRLVELTGPPSCPVCIGRKAQAPGGGGGAALQCRPPSRVRAGAASDLDSTPTATEPKAHQGSVPLLGDDWQPSTEEVDRLHREARLQRYARNLLVAEVGAEGQRRLGRTWVTVAGDGAASWTAAAYLSVAGLGGVTVSGSFRPGYLQHLRALNRDTIIHLHQGDGPREPVAGWRGRVLHIDPGQWPLSSQITLPKGSCVRHQMATSTGMVPQISGALASLEAIKEALEVGRSSPE